MLELLVHALSHISSVILLCEHVVCIFYSFEDIHLLFCMFGFLFFDQVDGQECLRTFSSYLCFSPLKLYSCYITKFDQVRFKPLCVRSTRSPRFVIDLNFQNFFVCFGLTDSSISVIPRSLSRSRFSISVQPIWTFRSHRQGQAIYIHGSNFGKLSEPPRPRLACSASLGLRIILLVASRLLSLVSAAVNGIISVVASVASSSPN